MVDPMNDPSMSAASTSATSATTFARCDSRRRSTRGARALSFVRENARALRRSFARHERRDVTRSPFAMPTKRAGARASEDEPNARRRDDETTTRAPNARTNGDEDEDSRDKR